MENILDQKNVVLGVSGGIAVYKSVELLRLLTKAGAAVRVVMTANAIRFVGPLTFEALSGQPVCRSLFGNEDASIKHIDWAQAADAVVVAPATANFIGKLANGIADDALSTFMMAVTCPVLVCPSMNTNMYKSPAVTRNLETLKNDGHKVIEPDAGDLACGTVGPGRLPEPVDILNKLIDFMTPKDLKGKKILLTAGPTREPLDPVRFISNPSSGKMGYAIATAAARRGAVVTLVSGPTNLADLALVEMVRVETATEMAEAVLARFDDTDIVIKTAAVSDYRPFAKAAHKIKKRRAKMVLNLEKTVDILKTLGAKKNKQILVGFAAETKDLAQNAQKKLKAKNLDLIVANIVGKTDSGFNADTNKVTLFFCDGTKKSLPLMAKQVLAEQILNCAKAKLPS
jgi:phosphopantothenoylcysteine decarboxylase / phosphopantothenate---cysteine ligase